MRPYTLVLVPLIGLCLLRAQVFPAQAKPQEPALSSTQRSPFEVVPEPPQPPPPKVSGPTIEAIEFRSARGLPQPILRVLIASRVGGPYVIETLRRDAQALYSTGRFSEIVWETVQGRSGAVVRFVVFERPLIQSIEYQGDDTVTIPEILERFERRKVKLMVETLYHEDELERAAVTVQDLVAERGRQNIRVTPWVEQIWPPSDVKSWPPSTVKIIFRAEKKR